MSLVLALWLLVFGPGSALAELEVEVTTRDGSIGYASAEAEYQCVKALAAQCRAVGHGPASGARVFTPACEVVDDDLAICTTECWGVCDHP